MRKSKIALLFFLLLVLKAGISQSKAKRQKVDLGSIMIQGEIITPGDFSIEDEKIEDSGSIYRRKKYYDRLRIELSSVF